MSQLQARDVRTVEDARRLVEARSWAKKLVELNPGNPSYQDLLNELR